MITIIGANGYIGKHLSFHLHNLGLSLNTLSSSSYGLNPIDGQFPVDFTFPKSDVVVYLSQSPYFREVPEHACHLLSVNYLSAVNAALMGIRSGAKRFIYLSTGTVYSDSFSPISESHSLRRDSWYPLSKIHAEESLLLLSNQIDIHILRPFGIYGPNQSERLVPNLLRSIQGHQPIFLQPRQSSSPIDDGFTISLCYIDDIVNVISHFILNGGPQVLNVAGCEPLSIVQISTVISKILELKPNFSTSSTSRSTDLIANIDLLNSTIPINFTSFSDGIQRVLDHS